MALLTENGAFSDEIVMQQSTCNDMHRWQTSPLTPLTHPTTLAQCALPWAAVCSVTARRNRRCLLHTCWHTVLTVLLVLLLCRLSIICTGRVLCGWATLFRPPARRRRESSGAAARFLWVADASHWTRMASIDALFHSDFGAVEAPSRSVPCRSLSRRYRGRRLVGSPCREGRCAGTAGMRATGVPMWHAFVSIDAEVTFSPRVSHHSFL